MITEIHLDKDDIKQIISEKFDIDVDSVYVDCFMDYEGQGLNESKVPNVRVIIVDKNKTSPPQ